MVTNRAPFGYFGGKFRIVSDLQNLIPDRESIDCYMEPCFGSGTLFFNTPRLAENEVINDSNSDIYNFFRVLREDRESLIRLLKYTPYSIETFKEARTKIDASGARKDYKRRNLYRAWGIYVIYTMSVMKNGIGFSRDSINRSAARAWKDHIARLEFCAARLTDAIIENEDVVTVCKRYDSPRTFIYIDPPYLTSLNKRHERVAYGGNTMSPADHEKLLKFLTTCKSRFAISNYKNELYDSYLQPSKGFYSVDVDSYTTAVPAARGRSFHKKIVESLWLNFEPSRQLSLL